jgi:hypothetical protein
LFLGFRQNIAASIQDLMNKERHRHSKRHKIRKGGNFVESTREVGMLGSCLVVCARQY